MPPVSGSRSLRKNGRGVWRGHRDGASVEIQLGRFLVRSLPVCPISCADDREGMDFYRKRGRNAPVDADALPLVFLQPRRVAGFI